MSPLNAISTSSSSAAAPQSAPNTDAVRITALSSVAGVTVRLLTSLSDTLGQNFDARA